MSLSRPHPLVQVLHGALNDMIAIMIKDGTEAARLGPPKKPVLPAARPLCNFVSVLDLNKE
jgi:hypothetical protein